MCTADAFHAETQQHATNAAVMYAGSAENVHSRHRLHIEKKSGEPDSLKVSCHFLKETGNLLKEQTV